MDWHNAGRRLIHMTAPLYLAYYLVPGMVGPIPREALLLLVLAGVSVFEAIRLKKAMVLAGMREYERTWLAAYYQAAVAFVICFLLFPFHIVFAVMVGMAFVDPLIGELRKARSKLYPGLPALVYIVLIAGVWIMSTPYSPIVITVLALIGTGVALVVERPNFKHVNDDFLIVFVPAAVLSTLEWLAFHIGFF